MCARRSVRFRSAALKACSFVAAKEVDLGPDSITSVSAQGLSIPYGGTADGVNYSYDGSVIAGTNLTSGLPTVSAVTLDAGAVNVKSGAVLDLSGGGTVAGAAFISGRGGSVDVLTTPLINANPSNTYSSAGNKVYAIVPGYASGYAPVNPDTGAGQPAGWTADHDSCRCAWPASRNVYATTVYLCFAARGFPCRARRRSAARGPRRHSRLSVQAPM